MPVPARVPGHGGRYRFREYKPRDRKVLAILRAIAHDEPPTEAWGKPPADSILHRTVVLTDEEERGRVIGAARVLAGTETERVAHLQFVCIEDVYRDQGLGTALVHWTEVIAGETFGSRHVELEVDRNNERALSLYARLGYLHKQDASAASKAWTENKTIRRMLGPPRVMRFVKDLPRLAAVGAAS